MHRLDQQFVLRATVVFGLILSVIALSATLSQAARLTDDILERGVDLAYFAAVLLAMVPKMLELVAPLAFGIAVVLTCAYRNEAGTTLLLRAAGRSPVRDTLVVGLYSLVAASVLLVLSGAVVPKTQVAYRSLFAQAQSDSLQNAALPMNQPFAIGPDLTLTIGAHQSDGQYSNLTLADHLAQDETVILRADEASLSPTPDGRAALTLRGGSMQRISGDGRLSQLSFSSTTIALDRWNDASGATALHRRMDTLSTRSLFGMAHLRMDALEELTRRLVAAVSLISFSVLAASLLFVSPPPQRVQTATAVSLIGVLVVFLLLQSAMISASGFSQTTAGLVLAISASPLILSPFIRLARRMAG